MTCPYSRHRDPLAQFEIEKAEHEQKMRRMEVEMEEVFDMKVQEKLQKLKDIEADVRTLVEIVVCGSGYVRLTAAITTTIYAHIHTYMCTYVCV